METSRILFTCLLVFALSLFSFNFWKIVRNIRLGKPKNRFDQPLKRTIILLKVAFGQTKLFVRPVSGVLHAFVYWGFLVITVGTLEMMIDGVFNFDRCPAMGNPMVPNPTNKYFFFKLFNKKIIY